MRWLVLLALSVVACEDEPESTPPVVASPSGGVDDRGAEGVTEDPEPAEPADPRVACDAHSECRVLSGVCGSPTPTNVAHVPEMERMIEVRGRHRSCGVRGIAADDTTAACVCGACAALLGPPDEHRCERDEECVVEQGLCGPTESIAAGEREAFRARVQDLLDRHIRCGYGRVETTIRAVCDDGICVPVAP